RLPGTTERLSSLVAVGVVVNNQHAQEGHLQAFSQFAKHHRRRLTPGKHFWRCVTLEARRTRWAGKADLVVRTTNLGGSPLDFLRALLLSVLVPGRAALIGGNSKVKWRAATLVAILLHPGKIFSASRQHCKRLVILKWRVG